MYQISNIQYIGIRYQIYIYHISDICIIRSALFMNKKKKILPVHVLSFQWIHHKALSDTSGSTMNKVIIRNIFQNIEGINLEGSGL